MSVSRKASGMGYYSLEACLDARMLLLRFRALDQNVGAHNALNYEEAHKERIVSYLTKQNYSRYRLTRELVVLVFLGC